MSLEVLRPGPLALVQDAGRPGLAAIGVSPSGAFDRAAFAAGALLVGNDPGHDAGIEVTLGGLVVRCDRQLLVALTGAPCPATVDGRPAPAGEAFRLAAGQVLALGLPGAGLRTYLSVAGGLAVPAVLGSRSTDLLSGLGPARLAVGDELPVGPVAGEPGALPPGRWSGTAGTQAAVLELLPGPRLDWLADAEALVTGWTVHPDSNRVGVRLDGPRLARAGDRAGVELPSEPLVRGAVQLPPSGHPVVFGPDHPTTGGYPVVAVLTEDSSDRLAQLRPGERFRFAWAG